MRIVKIKETCLYVGDLDRTEVFYTQVLGAEFVARQPGRHVFFRLGETMLLCFIAATTRAEPGQSAHGATGSQHVAFEIPADEYEPWKVRLSAAGVAILHETDWKPGVRSFYFHDPDGHLLELIQPGLWEAFPHDR
ncbi:MAG: VOC family protein [Planctomycetota bacterium]